MSRMTRLVTLSNLRYATSWWGSKQIPVSKQVWTFFTEICEKLNNKVDLHKSFPTCDGDTTISIKLAVIAVLVPQFLYGHEFSIIASFIPCIRIMALVNSAWGILEEIPPCACLDHQPYPSFQPNEYVQS